MVGYERKKATRIKMSDLNSVQYWNDGVPRVLRLEVSLALTRRCRGALLTLIRGSTRIIFNIKYIYIINLS